MTPWLSVLNSLTSNTDVWAGGPAGRQLPEGAGVSAGLVPASSSEHLQQLEMSKWCSGSCYGAEKMNFLSSLCHFIKSVKCPGSTIS